MKHELNCAEFVSQALMPNPSVTAFLVKESALQRAEDFRTLARLVQLHPELDAHHAAWHDAAVWMDRLPLHQQVTVCSSPLHRRWLHLTGRSMIEGAPLEVLQPLLASVGNYVQGFDHVCGDCKLPLAVQKGAIETWDCSRSIAAPADSEGMSWYCRTSAQGVELESVDGGPALQVSSFDRPQAMLPMSGIVVRNDLPGLRVLPDEPRAMQRSGTGRAHEPDVRLTAYPQDLHQVIAEAATALLQAWPDEYADWRGTMRVVVPRLPPQGWRMEGFTLSSMQGAVWINPSNLLSAFESLVHEQSHLKLRYLEEFVPILQDGHHSERFRVSWRSDPRPLIGIYEGVYVHIHCMMALERYLEDGIPRQLRGMAGIRLHELKVHAGEGLALLRKHARFTEAGRGFLRWAEASLARTGQPDR